MNEKLDMIVLIRNVPLKFIDSLKHLVAKDGQTILKNKIRIDKRRLEK